MDMRSERMSIDYLSILILWVSRNLQSVNDDLHFGV